MAFLNSKEQIMDIVLTDLGRKRLAQGHLNIKYYAFHDDEIDYQAQYQNRVTNITSSIETLDLTSGGTFTRSTEGSYLIGLPTDGSTAFLTWAAINERRIENRGGIEGSMLLVEGARTNFVLQNRDITEAVAWSSAAGGATVTANNMTSPDGVSLADRIEATGVQYTRGQVVSVGAAWTLSAYVRGTSGASYFAADKSGAGLVNAIPGTTWARYDEDFGVGGVTLFACNRAYAAGDVDVGLDLYQAEAGVFPTSPIRTAGTTVTRGADILSYAVGQYPASFLTTGFSFTFAPDFSSAELVTSAAPQILIGFTAVGDTVLLSYTGANCQVYIQNAGSHLISNVTFSRNQILTFEIRPSANTITLSGFTTGNGTHAGGGAWSYAGVMYIGARSDGANPAFGRFGTTITAL